MSDVQKLAPALAGLQTVRLTLRPFEDRDIAHLPVLLDDIEAVRHLALVPFPYTQADAEWFVNCGASTSLAITTESEGLMGAIGLSPHLGFWIGKTYRRKGYVFEAASALIARRFSQTDEDLTASYPLTNTPSQRLQEKLGFEPTERRMSHIRSLGHDVPVQGMVLTKSRWESTS